MYFIMYFIIESSSTFGYVREDGNTVPELEKAASSDTSSRREEENGDNSSVHSIANQTNVLSKKSLLVAIPALSIALFVSFIDTTSVATSIPAVSSDLNTGTATSWIGSSFLVASTAFQLINGRLSDIFGRKNCLLLCLALLGIGDIGCGYSQNKEMLFVFRSIAGIGGGGINNLAMIIVSDITTLENRGKYQGTSILFAMSEPNLTISNGHFRRYNRNGQRHRSLHRRALVDSVTWRWVFWIIPMLALPAAVLIFFFLPLKHDEGKYAEKVKKIDYGGTFLNIAAVLLILIPLSGGGVSYAWTSTLVIAMVIIGGCTAIAFVVYECKVAPIPIMPLRLVKAPYCAALHVQNFFTGVCYYGNFFYLPIYFQSVLDFSALVSGALLLPVIVTTSIASMASGQVMSRSGRYMWIVFAGFVLWTLGTGLTCAFSRLTKMWKIVVALIVEGLGIGMTLQPTLVAILSNSSNSDRAVATGLRNFIRTIGGAFGLIISGAILANTLESQLSHHSFMNKDIMKSLTSSTYAVEKLGLTRDEKDLVLNSYMQGIRYIYVLYAACAGTNLLLCTGIGNTSPPRINERNLNVESEYEIWFSSKISEVI
ncbi:major facilitator superfamily transporter [Zopfia rhizophila CBS 207.26]|uniref:Major facilitator superfamily transporter n=1 Tax=Zopfia rhizophila CBS 207.26 TaxID=1314779 RepID=A0A6A6DUL1_9PEZI|nr:major facilitator superfamily transporter [Zopfia rhizophila CBS 207.26]